MSTTIILDRDSVFTEAQARVCIAEIKSRLCDASNSIASARAKLLEFHQKEGWLALGYNDFCECVEKEFGAPKDYFCKLLRAAQLDDRLSGRLAALGCKYTPLPEFVLREMTGMGDEELDELTQTVAAVTPSGEEVTSDDLRRAQEILQGANPDLVREESRRQGRAARKRARKRAAMTAQQRADARIASGLRLLGTAVHWFMREGWTRKKMHEAMDAAIKEREEAKKEGA